MHMANELLSVPVAAGTLAIAAAGLSFICRKLRMIITSEKLALMGVLGAFIFAAQMVNIPLPAMPGTSGHIVGAVLLAIILGPHAAAVVISSVVIVSSSRMEACWLSAATLSIWLSCPVISATFYTKPLQSANPALCEHTAELYWLVCSPLKQERSSSR